MEKSTIRLKTQLNNAIKLELYKDICLKTNGLAVLTGSLALILLGEIEERECHDLDIILPFYVDLSMLGPVTRVENEYTSTTMSVAYQGCTVHVIIDPKCLYTEVEGVKLSNAADIWIAKFKSLMLFGAKKGLKEIKAMLEVMDKPADNGICSI